MSNREQATLEARLRNKARKQGYRLKTSRGKVYTAWNQGGYMILDNAEHIIAGRSYELTIDDVIKFLKTQKED